MPILHIHSPRTSVIRPADANRPKLRELFIQLAERGASLDVCPPGFSGIITPHCWKSTIGDIGLMILNVDKTGEAAVIDRSGMHSNLGGWITSARTTEALPVPKNIHIPEAGEAIALEFSDSMRRDAPIGAPIQVGGIVMRLAAERAESFRQLHGRAAVAQVPENW